MFAGDGTIRTESASPDPIWDYGRWKAAAERVASGSCAGAAIVRLPLIVSVDPEDHVISDIRSAERSGEPKVWFTDEMRQPANALDLASAIWGIAATSSDERRGVWHLPGPEVLSRFDIARRAASALGIGLGANVGAPTPPDAVRPRDIRMTADRARTSLGWDPTPVHPPH